MTCPHCTGRIAELEEVVLQLRRELKLEPRQQEISAVMDVWKLSVSEARLILILYHAAGAVVPHLRLFRETSNDDSFPDVVKTKICRIRAVLGADLFATRRGVGYAMTPVGRARVYQALNRLVAA